MVHTLSEVSHVRALLLTGLSALIALGAHPALGAEAVIAIAATKIDGRVPGRLASRFGALLPGALGKAHFAVLDPRQVDVKLGEHPDLLGCATESCLANLAQELAVERLLWPRLSPQPDGLRIELTLFAVTETDIKGMSRVQPVVSAQAACHPCDEANLDTAVAQAAATLRQQLRERELEPPPAEPALTGTEPVQDVPQQPARRGRGLKVAKWTLGGIGLAALAAGGVLWALDGRQGCTLAADSRQCPQLLNTEGMGLGLFGGGAALIGVSAVLFGVDAYRRHESAAVVTDRRELATPAAALGLAGGF